MTAAAGRSNTTVVTSRLALGASKQVRVAFRGGARAAAVTLQRGAALIAWPGPEQALWSGRGPREAFVRAPEDPDGAAAAARDARRRVAAERGLEVKWIVRATMPFARQDLKHKSASERPGAASV